MCRWMSKVEYISKSCLSRSALIIQLNIFKYIDVISRKFFPNFRIDEGTSLWRNRIILSGVIRLTGKSVVNKQQIRPALVNRAIQKSTKINPFYNIIISSGWEDLSEQLDPVLWKPLTNKDDRESNGSDQTDSDNDIEGNDKVKESELRESSSPFPTVMYEVDESKISHSEVVDIAPGEGQILVSFALVPN